MVLFSGFGGILKNCEFIFINLLLEDNGDF